MSFIPGDEHHQDEPFFEDDVLEVVCEICDQPCTLHGDSNYCDACQARLDHEESLERTIPVLQPIKVRPVELDAKLWAEFKRIAEQS